MNRIEPKDISNSPEFKDFISTSTKLMGFLPIDALIMAHCPQMLDGASSMIKSILSNGTVDPGLKRMIGFITSQAAACEYCSAHTSYAAIRNGIDKEKFKAIWDFEASILFEENEKAALQFALKAGMHPNQTQEADFDRLKKYFSTEEIVEIVFTISMYAFLNKFNSSMRTKIEDEPSKIFKEVKAKV